MTQFENHHLGVWFYLNEFALPAKFRLGTSVLGGTDVLGSSGTGKTWQTYQYLVTEINVDNTVTLTGINPEYTGLAIDLTLRSDSDVLTLGGFSVGTWIKITLENYVPAHSSYPIWYVKTKSFTKELDADGMYTYQIHAEDVLQDVLGTPISDFDTTALGLSEGAYLIDVSSFQLVKNPLHIPDFETTNQLLLSEINPDVQIYPWGNYDLNVLEGQFSDIVQPITQGGAVWWYNKGNDPAIYGIGHRELVSGLYRTPVLSFVNAAIDNEIEVDYVNITQDSTAIVNDVLLSLSWDTTTFLQFTDQDLVDVYGRNRQELEFAYQDETGLTTYYNMIAAANKPSVIKSISCDAIIHKNRKLSDVWKLYPSSMVSVAIVTADLEVVNDYYVSGVKHTITPDGWNTTVELWRAN